MNVKNKIMIIGGHGKVGRSITRALKDHHLILVGRSKEKMRDFLAKENIQAETRTMNIDSIDFTALQDVFCVIVCVDQDSTTLVQYCDKHGINYMDVTANSEYIEKIQQLPLSGNSNILLGVGLAPGLTNLLAENFVQKHPSAKDIEIQLILGLGEKHGDAAIKWTLDNFIKDYSHKALGKLRPFTKKSSVMIHGKRLRTYNFNFVDQHMLNRAYPDKYFTTYLGFDQSFVTSFIYGLKKIGLLQLLHVKNIYSITETFFRNPKFGTDVFIASVLAQGHVLCAMGQDEGRFTGLIAGEVAKRFVSMDLKGGMLGIADVIGLDEVIENEMFGLETLSV